MNTQYYKLYKSTRADILYNTSPTHNSNITHYKILNHYNYKQQ